MEFFLVHLRWKCMVVELAMKTDTYHGVNTFVDFLRHAGKLVDKHKCLEKMRLFHLHTKGFYLLQVF